MTFRKNAYPYGAQVLVEPLDVIHWYMGCEFIYTFNNGEKIRAVIDGWSKWGFLSGDAYYFNENTIDWYEIDDVSKDGKIELILTDPTDLTKEQKADYKGFCYKCCDNIGNLLRIVDTPASILYGIENQVDMFDFIERGLAIDKTTLDYPTLDALKKALNPTIIEN